MTGSRRIVAATAAAVVATLMAHGAALAGGRNYGVRSNAYGNFSGSVTNNGPGNNGATVSNNVSGATGVHTVTSTGPNGATQSNTSINGHTTTTTTVNGQTTTTSN